MPGCAVVLLEKSLQVGTVVLVNQTNTNQCVQAMMMLLLAAAA
jgi:hypothetical protein